MEKCFKLGPDKNVFRQNIQKLSSWAQAKNIFIWDNQKKKKKKYVGPGDKVESTKKKF